MRKIYFVLAASIGAFFTTNAQVDLSISLNSPPSPVSGSTVAPDDYSVEFDLTNNGPDPIVEGDTIYFGIWIGNDLFSMSGVANNVNGIIMPVGAPNVEAGQTIPWTILSQVLAPATVFAASESAAIGACVWVAGIGSVVLAGPDPNDPNLENNFDCFDIDPALANVENITFEDATSIDVNANSVDISTVLNESISYQVVSITGQVVESGSFNNHVNVSTEAFNNGIYIVNINSSNGSKSVKFAVSK